ncbi:restriction endonuclease subunit S [Clostridium thermosuccinogenes]|uniref:restriction endonuclease subunit S n=1 Tax=Clostridium thermosuccinogenes TaxID=84032 RepID=UPI000CCC85F2|nr:restriction endonuclease subunit S [Pseudoclostridium thermosuccinogenes]PNT91312.1 hypothetical protein CDQ83_16050 [Pseudoclostridium thermosuccinogenes]
MCKVRDGYKMTEIGEIPEEWQAVKLGHICTVKSSKRVYQSDYIESGIPFYRSKEIIELSKGVEPSIELYISEEMYSEYERKFGVPQKNDLFISSVGTIGKTWVSDGRKFYYKDGNITQVMANDKINTYYLSYLFETTVLKKQYMNQSSGSAQIALTIEKLNKLMIPLPPLFEQQKIADILSTVDQQIKQTDALIEKTKELKKGLMQRLLTKGIGHTEFKDTEIGRIPKEWEVKTLAECAVFINGRAFKPSEWKEKGIPIIRIQNLNGSNDFNYFDGEIDSKYFVNKGQLLFSWSGSRGTSFGPHFWLGDRGVLNQHIFKVEIADGIDKQYFYYALKKITEDIEKEAHGSAGLVHITKAKLEKFKIPVPDISEQMKIGQILFENDICIKRYKQKFENLLSLKKTLMQKLLTGSIRVNI